MKIVIYYFSGTGNSFAAAHVLKEKLHAVSCESISLETSAIFADTLILVTPTYAYGLPELVVRFLKRVEIHCSYIAFLATKGTKTYDIYHQVHVLLKKKGKRLNYIHDIRSVENFHAIFKVKNSDDIAHRQHLQNEDLEKIACDIHDKASHKRIKSYPIHRFIHFLYLKFRVFLNKRIHITDSCIGCHVCENICPSKAIKVVNTKAIIDPYVCQTCQGCINYCPHNAIEFFKIKKETPKYHHKDASYKKRISS